MRYSIPTILTTLLVVAAMPAAAVPTAPWLDAAPFSVPADRLVEAGESWPAPPSADVYVLFRDVEISFDAEGRATRRQHLVYRALTADGAAAWATVEAEWAPWHQARPELRARVLTSDGRERWLGAETVVESPTADPDAELYDDRRVLQAPLPGIQPGALVEEETVIRDTVPFFDAGTAGVEYLVMTVPMVKGRLTLDAPIALPLRFGVRRQPGLEPRREVAGERVRLIFDVDHVEGAGAVETGLPSHQARYAHVAYSTGESWQAIARRYSEIVDQQIGAADLAPLVASLPAVASQAGRIPQLLARVHDEVRYTGLELGAASLVPAPPSTTLERQFGDCKDQATLVVALLRAEGIPAYVALLDAGWGKDVDSALPGLGRFNHAIVYVPAREPIWIDPTDPVARPGELPSADQGRWALIASPNTEQLLRTPASASLDNRTIETREVFLPEFGRARFVETTEYHGQPERDQRQLLLDDSIEDRREGYTSYVESAYLAKGLGEVSESDSRDLSQPFRLSLEALDAGRGATDLDEAVVAVRFEDLFASLPSAILDGEGEREGEFVVDQPFVHEWRYRVEVPAGFEPRQLPADVERRFGPAELSETFDWQPGELRAVFRFDSGPRLLSASELVAMRDGVQAFLEEEPLVLWFDHVGAAALAAGRHREGIEESRRLAELQPDRALPRVRYSRALLVVGLGGEAQRQARRATELEPTSALAWWALGLSLQYDEIGRRFGAGFDRDAAVAAARKAVDLDPDLQLARAELAILLEHDAEGRRYAAGADLDEAIEQYRALQARGVKTFDVNLLLDLYWRGRYADLETATRDASDSKTRRALRLTALAVTRGAEAARQEAVRLTDTTSERGELMGRVVKYLLMQGNFASAGALLRSIAAGAANPTLILRQAEILERAAQDPGRREPSTESPEAVVLSVFDLLRDEAPDPRLAAGFFHPDFRKPEALAKALSPDRFPLASDALGGEPVARGVVVALVLAGLQTEVLGSDELGYRVRLNTDLGGKSEPWDAYVLPWNGGGYRIVAFADEGAELARATLGLVEQGRLDAARQWLDWVRESRWDPGDDEPFSGAAFARYWKKNGDVSEARLRRGAALLMATTSAAPEALPVLREALEQVTDPEERRVFQAGTLQALILAGDRPALAAFAGDLLEEEPTSAAAFDSLVIGLGLDKDAALTAAAERRLERLPDDPRALRVLLGVALDRRKSETFVPLFEKLRDLHELQPSDYNLWSWALAFEDPIPGEALELAKRGATLDNFRERDLVHTLATLYAELERPNEAYQTLLKAVEISDGAIHDEDWFVLGRIAETYGFPEIARQAYARVEKNDGPLATWTLAQRRLKGLKKSS